MNDKNSLKSTVPGSPGHHSEFIGALAGHFVFFRETTISVKLPHKLLAGVSFKFQH